MVLANSTIKLILGSIFTNLTPLLKLQQAENSHDVYVPVNACSVLKAFRIYFCRVRECLAWKTSRIIYHFKDLNWRFLLKHFRLKSKKIRFNAWFSLDGWWWLLVSGHIIWALILTFDSYSHCWHFHYDYWLVPLSEATTNTGSWWQNYFSVSFLW